MKYFIGFIDSHGWMLLKGRSKKELCLLLNNCIPRNWDVKKFNKHFTESNCGGNIETIENSDFWFMTKDKQGEWI